MHLPEYAYIPGISQRHPETAFDALKSTALPGHNAAELAACDAFTAGIRFLHEGYYWESHEVLEAVWMRLPDGSTERAFVQGLIQLANGHLKLRMGRHKAALRLVGQARSLVPAESSSTIMTLKVVDVHQWINRLEADLILSL